MLYFHWPALSYGMNAAFTSDPILPSAEGASECKVEAVSECKVEAAMRRAMCGCPSHSLCVDSLPQTFLS